MPSSPPEGLGLFDTGSGGSTRATSRAAGRADWLPLLRALEVTWEVNGKVAGG
jgi:hypothetical protein